MKPRVLGPTSTHQQDLRNHSPSPPPPAPFPLRESRRLGPTASFPHHWPQIPSSSGFRRLGLSPLCSSSFRCPGLLFCAGPRNLDPKAHLGSSQHTLALVCPSPSPQLGRHGSWPGGVCGQGGDGRVVICYAALGILPGAGGRSIEPSFPPGAGLPGRLHRPARTAPACCVRRVALVLLTGDDTATALSSLHETKHCACLRSRPCHFPGRWSLLPSHAQKLSRQGAMAPPH